MNMARAQAAAADGALIKRSCWDNWLRMKGDVLEFVIAVQIFGKTKDASYKPHKTDRAACDWESERAA